MRIIIDGNTSLVEANAKTLNELWNYFSVDSAAARNPRFRGRTYYKDGKQFTSGWDGKVRLFSKLTNRIATGLVPMITDMYPDAVVSDMRSQLKIKKYLKYMKRAENYTLVGPDDGRGVYQKEAVQRFIKKMKGIIKIATNGGKTKIAAGMIKVLDGCNVLYLVHRKTLLHQVARELEAFIPGLKCGKIGDGHNDVQPVTIAMVQSLPDPVKKNRPFYAQWQCLIMDECQHGGANTWYRIAMQMNAKFKVALSGTPWTGKDEKDLRLISVFGPRVLIEIKNQQLIEKGWSATPTIHFWPVPHEENALPWRYAYTSMLIDNAEYNEQIIQIIRRKYEEGKPVLCIVSQKRHGHRLYKRLIGEEVDTVYLDSTQKTEYREKCLEKFKAGKLGCIVATSIFDEGVDVPAIRCLVLAGGGKAPIALLQRVGRALRKKSSGKNTAEIHDFIHYGNYYLLEHTWQRIEIYEGEDFDIRWHEKALEGNPVKYSETGEIDWHKFHKEGMR
jgi:superfamily II DNA or RNA helicase